MLAEVITIGRCRPTFRVTYGGAIHYDRYSSLGQ